MKKLIIAVFFTALILCVCGCSREISSGRGAIGSVYIENEIEMKLFSDKEIYKMTDAIQIWAMLEYVGDGDSIEIWFGKPDMIFSITDGKNFNSGGIMYFMFLSNSAILEKGEIYRFEYQKSGGWGADEPDADFWESFYAEEELFLPKGKYTASVSGNFSFEENGEGSGFLCELPIKVVK